MKIHFVIHENFEAPMAFEIWGRQKGHKISYTRLYLGEKLPPLSYDFNLLIVMGGPQSPATTLQECAYFDAKKELAFIKKSIDLGKFVIGVCLGAQMIGEALGGKYAHSPYREIGNFSIKLTKDGVNDPHFSTFPHTLEVGHWHGDMPGITAGSTIIAASKGCPRQIVRYSPYVYGFQCHLEFIPEGIDGLIENSTHELEEYKDLPFVQNANTLRNNEYAKMNAYLYHFLDSFTG